MITLRRSMEFHLEETSESREELAQINEEKEVKLYYKQCGGKAYVQNRLKFLAWWENLPEDLTEKIIALPLKVFNLKKTEFIFIHLLFFFRMFLILFKRDFISLDNGLFEILRNSFDLER